MSSTEAKAALAKRHFEAILTSAGEGIYGIDSEARLVFMNTRAREMLGLELDFDVIGKSAHALNRHSISETEPCDGKNCHVIQTMRDGLPRRSDDQYFRRQDGTLFPIELSASAIIEDGVKVGAVVVFSDISDRKRNLEQLRSSQQLLDTIVENLPDMVCLKRVDNLRFEMINRTGLEWLGLSLEQAIGKDAQNVMPKEMTDCRSEQDSRALQHCGRIDSIEETIVTLKGVRVLNTKKVAICDSTGHPTYLLGISEDITERKRAEEQIEHLAFHDQLTELPNRTLLLDRLGQCLAAAQRTGRFGAVMFVDLDQFKQINDVYGHSVGDQVLKAVAGRLRYFLRQGDTVSRFGGDEFVVLLPELGREREVAAKLALTIAEKIRIALESPIQIMHKEYLAPASIGITLFPSHGENVEDLIREADIAMYRAKAEGRNRQVFFEQAMQAAISERYVLEQELRDALSLNQLALYVQSQVDKSGNVIGAESLVRWLHPVRGLIQPVSFISLAEDTGLIISIGEWVLREACRLIVQLHSAGKGLRLAVNVSPRQFHQVNFVSRVKDILAETGADPVYLTLEITENLLVDRTAEAVTIMLSLSELGIRFSIDDFGTGYSSLSYLKRLPLKELKIDKSFVQDVPHDPNNVALVETILSMAHHLGFEVVAEGVETREQFNFLSVLKCEYFQGYHFHRPQPMHEWLAHLDNDSP